jgi:cobalt/nickel transport system permease protein
LGAVALAPFSEPWLTMAKIESSFLDISTLDTLSYQKTAIHLLDPRAKLVTTMLFVGIVLSFDKYEVAGLIPFAIYPVALIALANLPVSYLLNKVLLAAPFAFFVGIFNPLLDRTVMVNLGPIGISGGWVSFASIMIRFTLTVIAALVLIASTGLNSVCMALEKMGTPRSFAVQLLFLYRYIFVLTDEASRMSRARSLRVFEGRGMGFGVFTHMIGQLLLRTLDRAKRIHLAMRCRGFDGEIRIARPLKICGRDIAFVVGWSIFFVAMRFYDLPQWLGSMVAGLIR